eukprot:jgi/Pico_ML_1/52909/g3546.t1
MTVSYVLIYSITLYVRYKRGWVTQEMLDVPKKTLVLAGMFEAVGLTLGLLGASGLPGAVLPVFSQLILIWQLILSYTLLGRRYPFTQLLGIAMVAMGVATTTNLGTSTATLTVPSCARYLCIYILSLGCPAMSILLKEKVFSDFRREKEKDLDLFVVNTFSSFSQGISVLLFLPVISRLQGVMVKDIPSYMIEGLFCFFGQGNRHGLDSTGAPFFPLLYVAMNLCFNVSVLRLTIGTMGKRWMDGKRNDTKAAATNTEDGSGRTGKGAPWLSIASVMGFSVLNRVTYKMALVPLANHIFFLAQFMTVSYVLIYSITLYVRYKRGWVTQEMLDVPKKTLVLAGMFEAVGLTLGLLGASGLPGAVLPVFSQLTLLWQLFLSYTVLGRKYPFAQLVGIAMVAIGVATAAIPGDSSVTLNVSSCATYLIVYILSLGFPSVATIFKEKVFKDAKAALGRDLDIFVVNTYSSVFQGIGVLLFLPVISRLQGVSFRNIPSYMSEGFYCFIGQGSAYGMDSTGAPFFPLLYMGMNLVFNISVLRLLRSTSSVISSMVLSTTIPLTILAFMVQLPLLPAPRPVGPMFWPGVGILFLGLGIYNFHKGASSKEKQG